MMNRKIETHLAHHRRARRPRHKIFHWTEIRKAFFMLSTAAARNSRWFVEARQHSCLTSNPNTTICSWKMNITIAMMRAIDLLWISHKLLLLSPAHMDPSNILVKRMKLSLSPQIKRSHTQRAVPLWNLQSILTIKSSCQTSALIRFCRIILQFHWFNQELWSYGTTPSSSCWASSWS